MTEQDRPFINPYMAILAAVLAAAFSSIFTKLAQAPPIIIAFYRLLFTLALIAPFVGRAGWRELRYIGSREKALAALAGIFLALHFSFWITSLNYTSVSSSTVLVTLQPIFVIAGGYFLYGETLGRAGLAGVALALLGSVLVGLGDFRVGGQALLGDIMAFAGAFFVAGYVIIGRGLRQKMSLLPYLFLVYGMAALTLLAENTFLFRDPLLGYPGSAWFWFFLLALVPTIMGHNIFNWALRYVRASVVSVSILGEPVGATILAYFIFAQQPGPLQITGALIIMAGVTLFILHAQRDDGSVNS